MSRFRGCLAVLLLYRKYVLFSLVVILLSLFFANPLIRSTSLKDNYTDEDLQKYEEYRNRFRDQEFIKTATQLEETLTHILVTFVNVAYKPFVYSWLCNTKRMGVHIQVLIITADEEIAEALQNDWPQVKTVVMTNSGVEKTVLNYGEVSFERMTYLRVQIIYELLESGFNILWFEVDSFWYKNPLPKIKLNSDYDIVIVEAENGKKQEVPFGFMYLKPTVAILKLWRLFARRIYQEYKYLEPFKGSKRISKPGKDQIYFSDYMKQHQKFLKLKWLRSRHFVSGQWYDLSESEKEISSVNPWVIHNDFNVNVDTKIKTAKAYGQWFIHEDFSCNEERLDVLTNSRDFYIFYQNTRNETAIKSLYFPWWCIITTGLTSVSFMFLLYVCLWISYITFRNRFSNNRVRDLL